MLLIGLLVIVVASLVLLFLHYSTQREIEKQLADPERNAAAKEAAFELVLPPDALMDDYCETAAKLLDADVAFCSFVTADRQFVRGSYMVPDYVTAVQGLPIEDSICRFVAGRDLPLALEDASQVSYLRSCSAVRSRDIRGYIGYPIHHKGRAVGALAVGCVDERVWTPSDHQTVQDYAEEVSNEIARRNESVTRN